MAIEHSLCEPISLCQFLSYHYLMNNKEMVVIALPFMTSWLLKPSEVKVRTRKWHLTHSLDYLLWKGGQLISLLSQQIKTIIFCKDKISCFSLNNFSRRVHTTVSFRESTLTFFCLSFFRIVWIIINVYLTQQLIVKHKIKINSCLEVINI